MPPNTDPPSAIDDSSSSIDLPVIDLSPHRVSSPFGRRQEMEALMRSFTDVGFCLVKGIKERGYDAEELLRAAKWFFGEVDEGTRVEQLATKAFNPSNCNLYRGFFPLRHGGLSHKEGYDISRREEGEEGAEEGNPFKEGTPRLKLTGREGEVDRFYKTVYKHRDILQEIGDLIFSLIAEAGGADFSHWEPLFGRDPLHTLRLIRYPKRTEQIPKGAMLPDGRIISTGAHQDSGLLTLLQVFGSPGLELQHGGQWYRVEARPDTLVVNLGEQMTDMSNGLLRATVHRVLDIGRERFSVPFFYEPCCDGDINIKIPEPLLPEGKKGRTEGKDDFYYPYASFLFNKLPIYTEYASITENLPEGMLEKYLGAVEGKQTCWAKERGIEVDGATTFDRIKKGEQKKAAAANA